MLFRSDTNTQFAKLRIFTTMESKNSQFRSQRASQLNPLAKPFRSRKKKQTKMFASDNSSIVGLLAFKSPLPFRRRAKLTYHESSALSITTGSGPGVAGTYVFTANGLFDPNFTGAGHQPLGFDQWMVMYDHYTVHSCTISVIWATSAVGPLMVSISRSASSTGITDVIRLVENGNINYQMLPVGAVQTVYSKQEMSMDMAKFVGVDDVFDMSELRGTSAANPAENAYFHLSVWSPFVVTQLTATATVVLEFDATFTEPRMLTTS